MKNPTHFTVVVPYAADISDDADLVCTFARNHFHNRMWVVAPDVSIKEYIVRRIKKHIADKTATPSKFCISTTLHKDHMEINVLRGGYLRYICSVKVFYSRGRIELRQKLNKPTPNTINDNEDNQ